MEDLGKIPEKRLVTFRLGENEMERTLSLSLYLRWLVFLAVPVGRGKWGEGGAHSNEIVVL